MKPIRFNWDPLFLLPRFGWKQFVFNRHFLYKSTWIHQTIYSEMYKFNLMKQALVDSIEEGYIRYENSLHIYRLYRFLKVSQKSKRKLDSFMVWSSWISWPIGNEFLLWQEKRILIHVGWQNDQNAQEQTASAILFKAHLDWFHQGYRTKVDIVSTGVCLNENVKIKS